MTRQLTESPPRSSPPAPAPGGLAERCRELGLLLLRTEADGRIAERPEPVHSSIERALLESPIFHGELRYWAERWAEQQLPEPAELWPGCWLLPVARQTRRRRSGYYVGVLLTAELPRSEQFGRLCDAARLDHRVASRRFQPAAEPTDGEIDRLARILRWLVEDLDQIGRQSEELRGLSQQLAETYEELSLTYKLSGQITCTRDARQFLEEACAEIQQVLGLRWVALQFTDEARLQELGGETVLAGDAGCGRWTLRRIAEQLHERFGTGEPIAVDAAAESGIEGLDRVARQLLLVPIMIQGSPTAILLAADKEGAAEFSSVDTNLITATAQNMSIFIENNMLYEDMQDMFMGTLHSLIASIDAKDTYTCGHSERVAWLSRQLAEAAGLDSHTAQRTYLSGLVHDVGKIGVPEVILCKSEGLTSREFEMIRAHPEIGVRILRDIPQMNDLLPGVLYHHERYHGGGYPYGLRGEDIPLFGRIIALADSFDAMSSDRTYRCGMSLGSALEEISRCAGTQFDPDLTETFLSLDFEAFYQMLSEHQRRQSPLHETMRIRQSA